MPRLDIVIREKADTPRYDILKVFKESSVDRSMLDIAFSLISSSFFTSSTCSYRGLNWNLSNMVYLRCLIGTRIYSSRRVL